MMAPANGVRTAVFSIISPNYRHFARVLMTSVRGHHPDWEPFVLMVGATSPAPPGEPFMEIDLEELPLPNRRQLCFRYTILELNTAVKPWMFEHLFARGYDRVVYLDPDIHVYSPLSELDAASDAFMILTPHLTRSIPGNEFPSEQTILFAGTYNLGFLAVSRREPLARFLEWWKEKLEFHCVVDRAGNLFVDQKWMDLAPGLFPGVFILRHEGYNVAYWNLAQREVRGRGAAATVNGQPLRFFHFSGCDPMFPQIVTKHDPKQTVAAAGDAGALVSVYFAALRAAGATTFRDAPYAYGAFDDGTVVPDGARIAYRNSRELQAACGNDPFAHAELFRAYRDFDGRLITRVVARARPFIRLLPKPVRNAAREFLRRRRAAAMPAKPARAATPLPAGVNVVGYFSRDTGVGESARAGAAACEAGGLLVRRVDVDSAAAPGARAAYRVTVAHVNAAQTLEIRSTLAAVFEPSAYNIALWHWELPELPDHWSGAAAAVDEIWAPSAFIQSAISRKVSVPVVHLPHGVTLGPVEPCPPSELGVPEGRFVFLCMFDFDSVVQRKNPAGAVEAFRRAFPGASEAALLIKTTGGEQHAEAYARLAESVRSLGGVYLCDRTLTRAKANGLIASCDAVVSLHRSEGFGLVLAEAMSLGKPVVATGWSGNMDFMSSGNSCPVAYDLVTLDRDYHVYAAGQQWAEPDLDHAAFCLRRIVSDTPWRRELGQRACATMATQFSPRAAGLRYRRRLEFLGLLD